MRRLVILASALVLVLATGMIPVAPALAATRVPKVALIVGPVGSLTGSYRALADDAASAATAAGAQVVRVYSPDATWPAVKRAVDGASIVVYLGHGNGWPSRYRSALYPPTQDGFGLNPVAGIDDTAHQYFGEASVDSLRLAPDAVVVLSHLCYASGNTEPGLAEGTQDQAIARVDNYAAGFLRAGASAVVAEGHLGPAYYVKALLNGSASIEQIFGRSPSAKGNTFAVESTRTPGYTERLDPDHDSGGYYRSLVSAGVSAGALRAGARGNASAVVTGPPSQPSLASLGLQFGLPSLRSLPIAGAGTSLTLPLARAALKRIPAGTKIGLRWDPILLDAPIAAPTADVPAGTVAPATPSASPSAWPSASTAPAPSPAASAAPSAQPSGAPSAAPVAAPPVDLVVPEQVGTEVTIGKATATSKGLAVAVRYPAAPGLYRLVPTLHSKSGVAYDAATQALLTPVLVRVAAPVAVAWGLPAAISMAPGSEGTLTVSVVNAGSQRWDVDLPITPSRVASEHDVSARLTTVPAALVATWVSTDGHSVPMAAGAILDSPVAPGHQATVQIDLTAPTDEGSYLLMLDVVSPSHGPLSALGSAPGIIRVFVRPAIGPSGSPAPDPSPVGQATHIGDEGSTHLPS